MSARGQTARDENDRLRLVLRVTPKGGRDALEGWCCDANGKPMLKVRIAAAPADGKANASLVSLLAKHFGVPQNAVTITRGATGRVKQVIIEGDSARLSARLSTIGRPA